jgi:glycosyltransferase involved in cell wall biosynthesis
MTPTVSVIIPSYNHERFVKECIKSVLDQTFQDFEILITDDGSTDHTVKGIKSYNDPRIKLFEHKKNRGACVAANNCVRHSNGKYIAMLSSDDAWYPEKLAIQVTYLEDHPSIAAVFGKVDWIDENSNGIKHEGFPFKDVFNVKNRTRYEWLGHFFQSGNCLCHPSSMIRKEFYDEVGWLNPSLANLPDFDLWIRFCFKYDIYILDQKLVKFRRMNDEKNASGVNINNRVRIGFEFKKILDHYLKIQDPRELSLIFPDAVKYGVPSQDLIPYFLGRIALDSGIDIKMLWGLEQIYTLLMNEIVVQKLDKQCGFTYRDFIRFTGECDPFRISLIPIPTIVIEEPRFRSFLIASKKYLKAIYSVIRTFLSASKSFLKNIFRLLSIK